MFVDISMYVAMHLTSYIVISSQLHICCSDLRVLCVEVHSWIYLAKLYGVMIYVAITHASKQPLAMNSKNLIAYIQGSSYTFS